MNMDLDAMGILPPTHRPEDCEPTQQEIPQILLDRLARVRAQLKSRDISAAVLFDPAHVRYATGSRNMQVYSSRNPAGRAKETPSTAKRPRRSTLRS